MADIVGKVCYTDSYMKSIKHFRLIIQEMPISYLVSYLARYRIAELLRIIKLQNKCSTQLLFKLIIIN